MIRLLAVVMLVACSGRSTTPVRPDPPPPEGSNQTATVAAAPTEAECDNVLAHALALENGERSADQKLSADEQAKLRDEWRAGFQTDCRAWTREAYGCALAAAKVSDISACDKN